jgi:glutamate:Na+ symporter, ESS family
MEFTPWALVTDLAIICALLMLAQVLRARVRLIQASFLPASIIAGAAGLALGPNGLDVLPFSDQISKYPGVLIVLIMAAVPLGFIPPRKMARRVGAFYSYSQAGEVFMWSLGLLFGLAVLGQIWELPDGFGLLLALGWAGGFGTAAAAGSAFEDRGWAEATSLGYTAATVGVVVCIVGGLIATKWAARRGLTTDLASFDELPQEFRTGIVPASERRSIGTATISSNTLESLTLHIGLILVPAGAAYLLNLWLAEIFPAVSIPLFSIGFVLGLVLQLGLIATKLSTFVDRTTVNTLTGSFADVLVAFAIAAIVPRVVADNLVPLLLLFVFGLVYCVVLLRFVTPIFFRDRWFERGIFTWGWMTGSVPTGIALLRIVDSRHKSGTLEDFGIAFLGVAPVEIILITVVPVAVATGFGWTVALATLAFGIFTVAMARLLGWWAVPLNEDAPSESITGSK